MSKVTHQRLYAKTNYAYKGQLDKVSETNLAEWLMDSRKSDYYVNEEDKLNVTKP